MRRHSVAERSDGECSPGIFYLGVVRKRAWKGIHIRRPTMMAELWGSHHRLDAFSDVLEAALLNDDHRLPARASSSKI